MTRSSFRPAWRSALLFSLGACVGAVCVVVANRAAWYFHARRVLGGGPTGLRWDAYSVQYVGSAGGFDVVECRQDTRIAELPVRSVFLYRNGKPILDVGFDAQGTACSYNARLGGVVLDYTPPSKTGRACCEIEFRLMDSVIRYMDRDLDGSFDDRVVEAPHSENGEAPLCKAYVWLYGRWARADSNYLSARRTVASAEGSVQVVFQGGQWTREVRPATTSGE